MPTVKEMYRSEVHYEFMRAPLRAALSVLATATSILQEGDEVLKAQGARLMIGRGVIRNRGYFGRFGRSVRRTRLHPRGWTCWLCARALRGGLLAACAIRQVQR